MDDLLKPIKTVKKVQGNIDKFENLSLNSTATVRANPAKASIAIVDITSPGENDTTSSEPDLKPTVVSFKSSSKSEVAVQKHQRHDSVAFIQKSYLEKTPPSSLPNDALEIIKSQPDHEDLLAVLQYLEYGVEGKHDFNIHVTSAKSAQIINALVTVTIPDHWHILKGWSLTKRDQQMKKSLLLCLSCIAGIGALLMQIRTFGIKAKNHVSLLQDMLSVLNMILDGSELLKRLLDSTKKLYSTEAQRRSAWNEITSLIAGSKVLSVASQACSGLDLIAQEVIWLSNGNEYSRWLARNIISAVIPLSATDNVAWIMVSQIMKRGLSLGYRDTFISDIYTSLVFRNRALWTPLNTLLRQLSIQEQRLCFDLILKDVTRRYLGQKLEVSITSNDTETRKAIGGVAALVQGLVQHNSALEEHVTEWLTSTTSDYANFGLGTRRAVIATLASNKDQLRQVLDKCLDNFGDKLQIQHNPVLQQEALTQVILLAAGYLASCDAESLHRTSKSALFMHAISNRLGASIPRARLLGMIVATAVSRLADGSDKAINFGVDEMETQEARIWLGLTEIKDTPGQVEDLLELSPITTSQKPANIETPSQQILKRQKQQKPFPRSEIISIEEIVDDGDETDEDLPSYQKPDDDPSDSDEDPTLVNRNKPSAPVYIVDLIKQLQADDKSDTVELALRTAPDLIRRKANFGSELSENVQVVAAALINLKEGMSEANIQQLRQQALLACLVSKPAIIGPWLASMYFEGDFALDQRATMLSAVGLGARELAGWGTDDESRNSSSMFPTKHLPSHLAAIYAPTENIAGEIEHATLQPMALAAADKLSGPDVLKVRIFSSRMEVKKKQEQKNKERTKRIPKDLHKLLAQSLYLPLCCRMSLILSSNSDLGRSTIFEPHILRLFLQTLSIILFSLGPNALQLSEVSRETLLLLTALHNIPKLACDPVVLPALLQLLLTTMDLNIESGSIGEERLVAEFGPMLAELISWAGDLEKMVSVPVAEGNDMPGMPWNIIVAGIQVKWHEVGRKYQGRMLGLMGGDLDEF